MKISPYGGQISFESHGKYHYPFFIIMYWLNQDPYYSWFVYHILYHIDDYIIA